jgi:UDP-glucose 4-epimerase
MSVVLLTSSGFVGGALRSRLEPGRIIALTSRSHDLLRPETADRLAALLDCETHLLVTARMPAGSDPLRTLADETTAVRCVGQAIRKGRPAHVTYFSSTAVYGDAVSNRAITEETLPAPASPYAWGKLIGETILRQACEQARVPLLVLRPCMIYGPGDRSPAYGPTRFLDTIRREGTVRLFGDGSEMRDYIYIDDLVEITLRLALDSRAAGVYNLTGGAASFRELIEECRAACGLSFDVIEQERMRPPSDQVLLADRLRRTLPGFRPTPLAAGLAAAWNAVQREGALACRS